MASHDQKVLRTGQGCYQEVSWDRGRVGEKHLKELGRVVAEGHGPARAPSFEEARVAPFCLPQNAPHPLGALEHGERALGCPTSAAAS